MGIDAKISANTSSGRIGRGHTNSLQFSAYNSFSEMAFVGTRFGNLKHQQVDPTQSRILGTRISCFQKSEVSPGGLPPMIRFWRWVFVAALATSGLSGCSNQYEDVGAVDISASKAKSAELGGGRGGETSKKGAARPPGHSSAAATSSR